MGFDKYNKELLFVIVLIMFLKYYKYYTIGGSVSDQQMFIVEEIVEGNTRKSHWIPSH